MRPASIYCDWALHDEPGDDVHLTEEMTMGVLDRLECWKSRHDVGFDYYLLDAFWFARPGDYRSFDPQAWPNGFEPARRRMEALGLTPGLWLDVTGGSVTGNEFWDDSLDVNTKQSYCLFDGPYADGLQDAMLRAAERWGVRLFKFDLANFYAVTDRFRNLEAGDIYARNVAAFGRILRAIRAKYPEAIVLAYNGFAHVPGYLDNTTAPVLPGIDPRWLDVVDYVYSGGPRPADVPCISLRRAVDMYQDHMVYKFHRSGIPLHRIDDHGCMVGRTNAIYHLGKRGWRRTWVQTLARGSRKAHFYGDVHLLDDDDVEFLRRARDLFFDLYRAGAWTRPVGGVPCQSPWHGFLTGNGEDGLLVVVNPSPSAVEAVVTVEDLSAARVIFCDAGSPADCSAAGEALYVRLAPEQMALVGLGQKADRRHDLGTNVGGDRVTPDSARMELAFVLSDGPGDGRTAECRVTGAQIKAAAERDDFDGLRFSFRLREGNQAYRRAVPREQAVSEGLPIEVKADGRAVEARALVPDVRVWSGCSWVTGLYPLAELSCAAEVSASFRCPDPKPRIIPEAWLQSL